MVANEQRYSDVRNYTRFTIWHALRRSYALRRIGSCGKNVFVETNVRLLRHPERIFIGSNVILKEGVRLCPADKKALIEIGDWTTVGHNTFVFSRARISIGANCLIAPFCYFVDNDHSFARGTLIREQPMLEAAITIGSDVWFGVGSTITRGVTIGDGAVVAANSVVRKDVAPGGIVAGIPARKVGER